MYQQTCCVGYLFNSCGHLYYNNLIPVDIYTIINEMSSKIHTNN